MPSLRECATLPPTPADHPAVYVVCWDGPPAVQKPSKSLAISAALHWTLWGFLRSLSSNQGGGACEVACAPELLSAPFTRDAEEPSKLLEDVAIVCWYHLEVRLLAAAAGVGRVALRGSDALSCVAPFAACVRRMR